MLRSAVKDVGCERCRLCGRSSTRVSAMPVSAFWDGRLWNGRPCEGRLRNGRPCMGRVGSTLVRWRLRGGEMGDVYSDDDDDGSGCERLPVVPPVP